MGRARWRPTNHPALIEAALLGGFGALLLLHAWRGTLVYYIHPRYIPLVVATGTLLLLATLARLRASVSHANLSRPHQPLGYLLLAIPLAIGFLVPVRPLGADALVGTALQTGETVRPAIAPGDDSREWNLLQWATAVQLRGAEVQGREVDAIGFVYRDPARPLDGFSLGRMVIVCCVADGSAVGLPVAWPGGAALTPDTWVRVRGTIGMSTFGGREEATVLASAVEVIPRPANPYLYP